MPSVVITASTRRFWKVVSPSRWVPVVIVVGLKSAATSKRTCSIVMPSSFATIELVTWLHDDSDASV